MMGQILFGVKTVGSVKRLFRVRITPANVLQDMLESIVSIAELLVVGYSASMKLNAWLKVMYASVPLTGKEVLIAPSQQKTEQVNFLLLPCL